ncbi:MAG: hypothetical protein HC780_19150 [Leptolyngbyaceae cyanobacterium CSU_1_3]|nr:hypothetical protein [Leptolyngbyaceae cyanobacterium CSU_1_3]
MNYPTAWRMGFLTLHRALLPSLTSKESRARLSMSDEASPCPGKDDSFHSFPEKLRSQRVHTFTRRTRCLHDG